MIIKSKKGNVPITILVIGVFTVCMLTLISFLISINKSKGNFEIVSRIEQMTLLKEKISLYQNLGFNNTQIKNIIIDGYENSQWGYFSLIESDIYGPYVFYSDIRDSSYIIFFLELDGG
ncbi:hypothetical protein K0A97_02425 [Patescibacteria group bacterium]|nr:hypothetical protein [Patescibacteria group bacterium]